MLQPDFKPQKPRSLLLACFGAALALSGAAASSALADSLTLSGPAAGTVGQPLVVQASGNDNPADGTLYLELDAIPGDVAASCPASYLSGSQLATSTGGSLVALDDREIEDGAGNFSMPVGYTPQQPGNLLLCGYTDDGATDTLAAASLVVPVSAAAAGGGPSGPSTGPATGTKPANVARPRVTRSGKSLVCGRGSWSGGPTTFSYRWLVNGRAKRGATTRKLRVRPKLRGHRVRCTVRASNDAGGASATSAAFRVR